MIRRILAAADSAEPAIAGSAALARRLGGSLRLASGVYDPDTAGERFSDSRDLDQARAALVEARRDTLEQQAQALRADGALDVSVAAQWARPASEALLDEARGFCADLLVIGTVPRRGLRHEEWHIVRDSPCPVLFTRGALAAGYRRVLIPVDPMHAHDKPAALDDALIRAARELADPEDGQLHLLHCYLPTAYLPLRAPGAAIPVVSGHAGSALHAHRDALQQLANRHAIAADRVHLEPGDARQGIPDAVRRLAADLVVMGAVARSRIKRLLIGSTTEAVIDQIGCDVLAVKPQPPAP